jgi:NAD(P)-dependent dehydrogenase (short-subunit alcohol dehydrogenase family)
MTEVGKRWNHKNGVLVTGASSGIGAAIAVELARAGLTVGCASRRGTLTASIPGLLPVKLDVTDQRAVGKIVAELATATGGLAGVVNAAGFYTSAPSETLDLADLRSVLETNFIASVSVSQAMFPYLRDGGGFIANVGSFYASLGVPRSLAYSASKAAMDAMTRTLAIEWAKHGISVLNFAPGYVETGLNAEALADDEARQQVVRRIPARRIAQADEIGRLIASVILANDGFLTGETIRIDGGQGIGL